MKDKDEEWKMKGERWRMKDEVWKMKNKGGFCWLINRWTDICVIKSQSILIEIHSFSKYILGLDIIDSKSSCSYLSFV